MVVDAQGEAATRAAALLSSIRETWAPTAGYNVDGTGEDRDGGVVRWTFVFDGERGDETRESSNEPSDDRTSPSWTITAAD